MLHEVITKIMKGEESIQNYEALLPDDYGGITLIYYQPLFRCNCYNQSHGRKALFFIDESGQDTEGVFFVVAVVIASDDLENWIKACEKIELESGKGWAKWTASSFARRLAYINMILQNKLFAGRLVYAISKEDCDYPGFTIKTISEAIKLADGESSKIFCIDGLRKNQYVLYGKAIRKYGVTIEKVTGGRDENNALVRLADAMSGFIRDACLDKHPKMCKLFDKAITKRIILSFE